MKKVKAVKAWAVYKDVKGLNCKLHSVLLTKPKYSLEWNRVYKGFGGCHYHAVEVEIRPLKPKRKR